jgi:hypothetical protein
MPPDQPYRHHNDGPPTPPEGFRALRALRLRFWVGGVLRDETWIDAADPNAAQLLDATAAYRINVAEMAEAAGVPWLTEVYDPAAPVDRAYLRIGTDAEGMVAPMPFNGLS